MRGVYITYWPAGGGRGQNPCRTGLAQGLDLCLKYGPRALCSQFYMSQGRLYVPREVDLADKTRVAALPSSCPPGQPPLGHIASLGTYRIVTRVPLGRIFRILSSSASSRPICHNIYFKGILHQKILFQILLRHIGLLEADEDKIRKIRPKGTLVTILYVPREPICPYGG